MRQVQEPIPRAYCCVVIHSVAESRRSQQQSEEDGAQTRSQRHSLTAQHLSPRGSPASACRPTSLPAEPSLETPSPSTTRLRSKAKRRLNAIRAGALYVSVILLFSIPFFFCFSLLSVYWHPFCYRTVSLPHQSSLTRAAYARIGHHVTDVLCCRGSIVMRGSNLRLPGITHNVV